MQVMFGAEQGRPSSDSESERGTGGRGLAESRVMTQLNVKLASTWFSFALLREWQY